MESGLWVCIFRIPSEHILAIVVKKYFQSVATFIAPNKTEYKCRLQRRYLWIYYSQSYSKPQNLSKRIKLEAAAIIEKVNFQNPCAVRVMPTGTFVRQADK